MKELLNNPWVVGALCIGAVITVYFRLFDSKSSTSLTRELEKLRTSWSPDQSATLTHDWQEFQAHNFQDYDQVVGWISRFSKRAEVLGFEIDYKIGEEGEPVAGLPSIQPVSIEFSLRTKSQEDGYGHFVQFVKDVTESDIAVSLDKIELSVTKSWRESWLKNLRRGIRSNANQESQSFEIKGEIG